jgi:hypothetical protein
MNLNCLFYDSVSEHFYWDLSYNLSWNSPLSLYYFWYLFFYNYLNNFFFLSNFDILYNLDFGLVNIDIFDDFYLSYYWDLSDDLYDLQIGNFNSYYFLDQSWHLYNLFNYSRDSNNFLYYFLHLNYSRNLNDFLYYFLYYNSLNFNNLFLGDYRDWHFNFHLFNNFLSYCHNFWNFLSNNFWFLLDVRSLNLYVYWLLLLDIQRNNPLYFYFFIDNELFSVRLLNNDFHLFNNFFSISLDEMSGFHYDLFGNLFCNLLFLNYWYFDHFLFVYFVWNWFFNNFSYDNLFFLYVSDELGDLFLYIDYFSIGDNMGNLSFYFYVFILFKYFLIDDLNLFDLFLSFPEINWFFHNFLHNFEFSMFDLNWHLYLDNLLVLNNYFFVVDYLHKLLFVQGHDLLYFNLA